MIKIENLLSERNISIPLQNFPSIIAIVQLDYSNLKCNIIGANELITRPKWKPIVVSSLLVFVNHIDKRH